MDKKYQVSDEEFLGLQQKHVSKWTRKELTYWTELLNTDQSNIGILTKASIEDIKQKFIDPDRYEKAKNSKLLFYKDVIELVEDIKKDIAKQKEKSKVTDVDVARFLGSGYVHDHKLTPPLQKKRNKTKEFQDLIRNARRYLNNKQKSGA